MKSLILFEKSFLINFFLCKANDCNSIEDIRIPFTVCD